MFGLLRPTFVLFGILTILTGILYPLAVTGIAQVVFPYQANGSVLHDHVGSELIGQQFQTERFFWGRPSVTAPVPYNGVAGTGSNLAATNPVLRDTIRERIQTLQQAHPNQKSPIPVDLVTSSGSSLDPHISPAAALYQVDRVARARNMPSDQVQILVEQSIEPRTFGVLGEPRVNVLKLNLALMQRKSPSY